MSDNVEDFNLAVAEVMSFLCEYFPVRQQLRVTDFLKMEGSGYDRGRHDWGLYTRGGLPVLDAEKEGVFLRDTVRWLAMEGYVTYSGNAVSFVFDGLVLTAKGLELMKLTPASLDGTESVGTRVKTALQDGALDVAKSSISSGMTSLFMQLPTLSTLIEVVSNTPAL